MEFWFTVLGVFLVDRAVKLWSLATLAIGERSALWPGVLEWRMSQNTGVALGLLAHIGFGNVVLPVAAVLLGWWAVRRYRSTPFTRMAYALVLGGFVGNLLDRLTSGFVLDMIYFPWMPWFVCNPADIAISVGVALLAASLLLRPGDWQRRTEAGAHGTDHGDGGR